MRFVCNELWGRRAAGSSAQPDGVTVTVHDSAMLYAVVGTFRSEDEQQSRGRSRVDGVARARTNAADLASRLEAECDAA